MAKQNNQGKENKESREGNKQIKICPRCGSTNITWDYESIGVARIIMDKNRCNDCGSKGNFLTIDKDKVKDFRKMLEER